MSAGGHDEVLARRLRAAGCVFAEEEAALLGAAAASSDELEGLVRRRVDGEPLEHLLGWVEFCGYRLLLGPGVFVPRARTALLVREALAVLGGRRNGGTGRSSAPLTVVDLCCGCGAVAAAVARGFLSDATSGGAALAVHAADVDSVAVAYAERNLAEVGGRAYVGDLYEALPEALRGHVDVLVVNAPYVPTDAIALMPPEARSHEPQIALDGGTDGLDVQRRVAAAAGEWLAPQGWVVVETSRQQAETSADLLRAAGLCQVAVVTDEDVSGTAVRGTRA